MNVVGALQSLSIKNIFYDKMGLRLFLLQCNKMENDILG